MNRFFTILFSLAVFFSSQTALAFTIDFDDIPAGNTVSDIGGVTFSSNIGLDLSVFTGLPTTSESNYLGVADDGDGYFLGYYGDEIYLDFVAEVTSISVTFIGTPNDDAEYSIVTDQGSSSKTTKDYSISDYDDVYTVIFTSAISFDSATLTASGDLTSYHIDDIVITYADSTQVPEPSSAILFLLGLIGLSRLRLTNGPNP
ncbi:PEP-CTERM sorting domain-containing protein [uncultured Desulfobacter sp.]|uniref:PEP-CTERM sorting domain-containing protein n=1 Tax=uncultured Desulfobacter sp. TaxID=240139 RepID=UPI0029F563F6|nr:PEP-CTERM sorting domain-containing protein [uncultured Desulfobacter sp.]